VAPWGECVSIGEAARDWLSKQPVGVLVGRASVAQAGTKTPVLPREPGDEEDDGEVVCASWSDAEPWVEVELGGSI
jgi:hypothetical protein